MRPPNTKILWNNEFEHLEYNEQRRFQTWKDKEHYYFDKIWCDAKIMSREETYKWLADQLNINESDTHFSKMTDFVCREAILVCQHLLNNNRRLDLDFGIKPITPHYLTDE